MARKPGDNVGMKKSARDAPDRMISGKMRSKAARGQGEGKTVAVDGVDYVWYQRHGWQVWGKGIKAVSISVSLRPERTRELILDLTLKIGPEEATPSERRLLEALPAAIREALEAGWDPESRGRAFRHEMAESV
jgi:hypothetical protein